MQNSGLGHLIKEEVIELLLNVLFMEEIFDHCARLGWGRVLSSGPPRLKKQPDSPSVHSHPCTHLSYFLDSCHCWVC